MKVIYVAGPYRGHSESEVVANIRHAEAAAIRLWQTGWAVICPHLNTRMFGGLCPDDTWLKGDLEILKRCDAIYMVDGWQRSRGATDELHLAQSLNMGVLYEK